MLIIVICVTAGVVSRKLLNHPLSWVEELCTLMFIYLAFFGASVAAMNGKHVSADFLTQKFSESGKKEIVRDSENHHAHPSGLYGCFVHCCIP